MNAWGRWSLCIILRINIGASLQEIMNLSPVKNRKTKTKEEIEKIELGNSVSAKKAFWTVRDWRRAIWADESTFNKGENMSLEEF
ncbi:hypothetical protein BCV71DRAFT_269441 [Rhizopus microsporus]|uniref:Uncharacterized protein n=1 Tax=Rhizopus microsporus TaxID=58291 RepID=A0A1X0RJL5_RHIZD|nr:hypothetical protein BCV71DRAFT_269441 [Rhizopus microsporus]